MEQTRICFSTIGFVVTVAKAPDEEQSSGYDLKSTRDPNVVADIHFEPRNLCFLVMSICIGFRLDNAKDN